MSDLTPEEEEAKRRKRQERLEQNRISARESRKRKKTMIEELQRTVIGLSRENKDLNERNEGLRRKLVEVGSKVRIIFCPLIHLICMFFFSSLLLSVIFCEKAGRFYFHIITSIHELLILPILLLQWRKILTIDKKLKVIFIRNGVEFALNINSFLYF